MTITLGFPTIIVSVFALMIVVFVLDKCAEFIKSQKEAGNILFQDIKSPWMHLLRPEIALIALVIFIMYAPRWIQ